MVDMARAISVVPAPIRKDGGSALSTGVFRKIENDTEGPASGTALTLMMRRYREGSGNDPVGQMKAALESVLMENGYDQLRPDILRMGRGREMDHLFKAAMNIFHERDDGISNDALRLLNDILEKASTEAIGRKVSSANLHKHLGIDLRRPRELNVTSPGRAMKVAQLYGSLCGRLSAEAPAIADRLRSNMQNLLSFDLDDEGTRRQHPQLKGWHQEAAKTFLSAMDRRAAVLEEVA